MTYADSNPSVFWARGSGATDPPSSTTLWVGKHVGEDPLTTRSDETIGYIVIEAGTGSIQGVAYDTGLGANIVRGPDNLPPYRYTLSGLSSASAAVVSAAGMKDNDGSWPVLYGATPLTSTTLDLMFDEDIISDGEQAHATEQVAYFVVE